MYFKQNNNVCQSVLGEECNSNFSHKVTRRYTKKKKRIEMTDEATLIKSFADVSRTGGGFFKKSLPMLHGAEGKDINKQSC
jgi:hypothetical protein